MKVNGGVASLASANLVAVSGSDVTLTLTLAAAVAAGDTATVSYVRPSDGPLRDGDGEVASFTDQS